MTKKQLFKMAKRILVVILSLVVLIAVTVLIYMQQPKFGSVPSGDRLARIQQSPNYVNNNFQDIAYTPTLAEGHNLWNELYKTIFNTYPRQKPVDKIPSVKTDILHLPLDSNLLIWFGHSSCFIQLDGKRILVDPVFSGNASPIPGSIKPFNGSDIYSVADMPVIDYLLISHDHYDHLDYETVTALKDKVKHVVCGLGIGADFERWGYPKEKILEKDWHEKVTVDDGFSIYAEPTRHQSGRTFKQNKTLWSSYVLQAPGKKIFISGDGGYDKHFADIGNKYGPIDLAIIENGQYDSAWHYIHLLPEETLKAAHDLKAKRLMPYHNSKFMLSRHSWYEPLTRLTALNKNYHIPLVTPEIGEVVNLDDSLQTFKQWWTGVH